MEVSHNNRDTNWFIQKSKAYKPPNTMIPRNLLHYFHENGTCRHFIKKAHNKFLVLFIFGHDCI